MPRIISGDYRGRRLAAPAEVTRPTSDRVREAVMSMLSARTDLADMQVLDLYAGTGALGIEAVSRGASSAVLVESDRKAAAVIKENIATCGATTRVRVVVRTVAAFLAVPGERFDLIFLDPPYGVSTAEVNENLAALLPFLAEDGWVVLERGSRSSSPIWPDGLELVSEKDYGDTLVSLAATVDSASA